MIYSYVYMHVRTNPYFNPLKRFFINWSDCGFEGILIVINLIYIPFLVMTNLTMRNDYVNFQFRLNVILSCCHSINCIYNGIKWNILQVNIVWIYQYFRVPWKNTKYFSAHKMINTTYLMCPFFNKTHNSAHKWEKCCGATSWLCKSCISSNNIFKTI